MHDRWLSRLKTNMIKFLLCESGLKKGNSPIQFHNMVSYLRFYQNLMIRINDTWNGTKPILLYLSI